MPTKTVAKKPMPSKPQAVKPAQKNVVHKKPAPDKAKGLPLLKKTPQASLVQKKPTPKPTSDKVENLAKEYLAELKEIDLTFEKGTAVLEKYRAKYPELASYIGRRRDSRAFQTPSLLHPPLSLKRSATATGFGDYRRSKSRDLPSFCSRYQTQIG
jgi:hypothetical protein